MSYSRRLARDIILDELFDLTLYRRLHAIAKGDVKGILAELIPVEQGHFKFWQDFFGDKPESLDFGRRVKLSILTFSCRLFGESAIHFVLEGIEVYGIRKYLALWEEYKRKGGSEEPLARAVQEILREEFDHEDAIVSRMSERKINPEKIRSIFLGFNDGLVEILGAVSGFFAAFSHSSQVLMASATLAVAGAFSMAAGAYVSTSSEAEVKKVETGKARFLGSPGPEKSKEGPLSSALTVGVSYFLGATVPVLPVLLGARNVAVSCVAAAGLIILVSLVLSFLSGMDAKKRMAMNLAIIAAAVGITYAIGTLARRLWGISL